MVKIERPDVVSRYIPNTQYNKENVQTPTRLTPFDDALVSFNHPAKFQDPIKRLKKMMSKIFLKGRLTIPKI